MNKTLHGRVHGKTIELDEDLGVADGQAVEVQVTIVQSTRKWGDGVLRSAGGWADVGEMDAILERIYQDRKIERRSQINSNRGLDDRLGGPGL